MYVRPPENNKIKLPENYHGNAFGSSGEYTDMPPPTRIPRSSYDLPPEEFTPRAFEEKSENMIYEDSPEPPEIAPPPLAEPQDKELGKKEKIVPSEWNTASHSGSIFSALTPPTGSSPKFPFGHGLGIEELLILCMMLLVFSHGGDSGESDNELILLLALLLFWG